MAEKHAPDRTPRKKTGSRGSPPKNAKKKAPQPRAQYSLEDILAEYRSAPRPEAVLAESEPQEKSTGRVITAEAAAFARAARESAAAEVGFSMPAPEPERAAEPEKEPEEASAAAETVPEDTATEEENAPLPPLSPVTEDSEESSGQKKKTKKKPSVPAGKKGGLWRQLQGYIYGRLAVIGIRRHERMENRGTVSSAEEPEAEPLDAYRFYSRQLPALERRGRIAALVTVLPVWIAAAADGAVPIPGALASDIRVASLVSLIAMLTVMIIGLDVIVSGVLSLCRGNPAGESLVALGCLAACVDCAVTAAVAEKGMSLPPCAVCCCSVCFALFGSTLHCRTYRSGFNVLCRNPEAGIVSAERLLDKKDSFAISSRREPAGFIRRSEDPDACEQIFATIAPMVLIAAPLLSAAAFVSNRSLVSLPHTLAVLLSVSAVWPGLFSLPGIMSDTALHLRSVGCACAGWNGFRELGMSRHVLITDADLFPAGTVSLKSVNIQKDAFTDQVIAFTAGMLKASGTELSAIFTELAEKSGSPVYPVTDFSVGEGGVSGLMNGARVCVGCAGYMYYLGIRVPPELQGGDAVYTAVDGKLLGAFRLNYSAEPRITAALQRLQRSRNKPIFAVRDFNVDQKLVSEKFGVSGESFEFPPFPERFSDSELASSGTALPAAVLTGGLAGLSELTLRSRIVFLFGRVCTWLTVGCASMGLVLGFLNCARGTWQAVSSFRLLLYMLLWLLPAVVLSLFGAGKAEK